MPNSEQTIFLSVITPVCNGSQWIEHCIKNVIDQGISNIEHIIIDDGSTDDTLSIIKRYAQNFSHITYYTMPNHGQSYAMNKGLGLAKGDVVSFLNVDDYYSPGALHEAMQILETMSHPMFLVGNCNVLDEHGNLLYINKPKNLTHEDLLLGWHVNQFPVNPSAYFYSRSLHEMIGYYNELEWCAFDLEFLLTVSAHTKMTYVDTTFGNFRFAPGTKTWEDQRRGTAKARSAKLMAKFQKNLPYRTRIIFPFKLWYWNNWWRAWSSAQTAKESRRSTVFIIVLFLFRLFDLRSYYYR